MKNKTKDIKDDEIRVIGGNGHKGKKSKVWIVVLSLLVGFILGFFGFPRIFNKSKSSSEPTFIEIFEATQKMGEPQQKHHEPRQSRGDAEAVPTYYDPVQPDDLESTDLEDALTHDEESEHSFIEITDITINDIPLRLYIPHRMSYSLHVGEINRNDPSILFAAQAADVRADNGGIVGAFVLKGQLVARGLSKKGFCAIIDNTVTVGVAENTSLFEEAIEKGGYFFRQYPLVDNGVLVENEPKGKSFRRAICDRNGENLIVETISKESFHDFAQALVDLGVNQAVYMVGSTAYGWAIDAEGKRHEFGDPEPPQKKWDNINYLIMKEAI